MLQLKRELVSNLFAYKYQISNSQKEQSTASDSKGFTQAMNRVPIIFSDHEKVLAKYDELYDCLQNVDVGRRSDKSNEVLVSFYKEICRATKINFRNWDDKRVIRVFDINH